MNVRNNVSVLFGFIFGILPAVSAGAVEYDTGIALRQNVLMFRWPQELSRLFGMERDFGISETRARVFGSASRGPVTVNGAIETKANFMSGTIGSFGQFQEGSLLGTGRPLRHWDLSRKHVSGTSTSATSLIDRMDVTVRLGDYDLDLGRQPISIGTSHFVGVLDVIAPFAPGDLDATYKPGVDAVRVRRLVGMTGEAEIIAVGNTEWERGALLGRLRTNWRSMDFEMVGGRFRERMFGGVGWEGEIAEWGFWGECAAFERKSERERFHGGWTKAAVSAVTGIERLLPADITAGTSLLWQDFGVRDPDDLLDVYKEAPFNEGWVFLGSCAYGVLTAHRQMHPLVNADIAGILNLVDGSTLWQPRISISTGDNTDLSVYGWLGAGEKPSVVNGTMTAGSEFGMMPSGGGFYGRWFF